MREAEPCAPAEHAPSPNVCAQQLRRAGISHVRPYTCPVNLIDRVREVLPEKYRELAKFLVVGGSSWILDTGIFTLLSHPILNDRVITSKIISVLISTIFNYILNREWSFSSR